MEQLLHLLDLLRASWRRGRWPDRSPRACCRVPTCRARTSARIFGLPGDVVHHGRHPAVVVDAAVAGALVVLRGMALLGVGVVERVLHADAGDRRLLDAIDDLGLGHAHGLEDRRDDVDHARVLPANLALGLDALGPVHDHPGVVAAAVRHRDRPRGGRRAGHRPADGVVRVGVRPAVLVETGQQIRHVFRRVVRARTTRRTCRSGRR